MKTKDEQLQEAAKTHLMIAYQNYKGIESGELLNDHILKSMVDLAKSEAAAQYHQPEPVDVMYKPINESALYSENEMWRCWQAAKHYFTGKSQPLNFNEYLKTVKHHLQNNAKVQELEKEIKHWEKSFFKEQERADSLHNENTRLKKELESLKNNAGDAVEFAEWILANCSFYDDGEDTREWFRYGPDIMKTSEQLYTEFKNQKE